jgi:hypothetical protein
MDASTVNCANCIACIWPLLILLVLPVLLDLFSRRRQVIEEPEPQSVPAE